jgi:ATP-dependent Clp protease protease subunit
LTLVLAESLGMHPTNSYESSIQVPGMPSLHPSMPDPLASVHYQRTREMTIDELLLENRVVFLIGDINYSSAARVIMQMLYLENQKRGQDINFYINSPGGSVDDTLAIYDTMRFISSDVATYCIGRAYSGGAVLLCAGQSGKRHILPHAQVMIHQPYGGVTGQTTDIQIQAEQIIKAKRTLAEIIARHCDQDVEKVVADGERDKYFSAHEAKEYGLVDEVFEHSNEDKKDKKDKKDA